MNESRDKNSSTKQKPSFITFLAQRFLPRFIRSWQGVVGTLALLPLVILPVSRVFAFDERISSRLSFTYTVVSTSLFMLLRLHYEYQQAAAENRAQKERIREAEGQVQQQQVFHDFVRAQLYVVVERANLLIVKAEGRANMLYGVGTILTIVSVFAPVVAIWAYVTADPLPPGVLSALAGFRGPEGKLPTGISVALSTARDWHILLAGMSFGFLFLAAAAALFGQHRRQMEAVFLLAADVDYFNRMMAGVEIASRADDDAPKGAMSQVVGMVIAELVRRPQTDTAKSESDPVVSPVEHLRQLLELAKQAKG